MRPVQAFPHLCKERPAAQVLQKIVDRQKPFQKFLVYIPLCYSCFLQLTGDPAESYPLRADKIAGIAKTAKPYQVRRQDLFSHSKDNHVYDTPRIKILYDSPYRTDPGARSARVARFDLLQTYLFRNLVFETRVLVG